MIKSNFPAVTIVMAAPLTDHSAVLTCINLKHKSDMRITYSNKIHKINYDSIIEELKTTYFDNIFKSQDANWCSEQLVSTLKMLTQKHSLTILSPRNIRCIKPWITPGLVRCIRTRDRMNLKCKKEPQNEIIKITYVRYKNFCNDLLKRLKRNYESNELKKYAKDPKKKWKIIDSIANRNHKINPANELLKIANTPEAALDKINDFYSGIAAELANTILSQNNNIHSCQYETQFVPTSSMALFETSNQEINATLMNLKTDSALGWDGIPTKLLKLARDIIVPILTHIVNLCFLTGVFPTIFKISIIHPIYKTGNKNCVSNYRPISVLPALSKIIEKIINKRLISYLEKENILSDNQFGFRAGKSTAHAVSNLVEFIVTNIDKKTKCVGVFLDLTKAFDTVCIPRLLEKMEQIGIRGTVLQLFTDYLRNRSQRVTINGSYSSDNGINYGVPQGSVLGPTLFLIYINNLCNLRLINCKIFTFADDTALVFLGENWEIAKMHAENGLNIIFNWLNDNLLTLNTVKTKYLLFTNSERSLPSSFNMQIHTNSCLYETERKIHCECDTLERTQTIKYLGVLLDEKLSWRPHISHLIEKTRKLIYIFKKLRHTADPDLLKTIYLALSQSILNYCITSWGGARKTMWRANSSTIIHC
ncbi:unnamed protein product, partial [Brenthis ino]